MNIQPSQQYYQNQYSTQQTDVQQNQIYQQQLQQQIAMQSNQMIQPQPAQQYQQVQQAQQNYVQQKPQQVVQQAPQQQYLSQQIPQQQQLQNQQIQFQQQNIQAQQPVDQQVVVQQTQQQTQSSIYFEPISCILEPHETLGGGLYLGGYDSAIDLNILKAFNIKAVLTVANGSGLQYNEWVQSHEVIPVEDVESVNLMSHFDKCLNFIDKNIKHTGVLVHCFAGVSRSATIIIAHIMKNYNKTLEQAINICRNRRPQVYPNQGFIRQLRQFQSMIQQNNMQQQLSPERNYPSNQNQYAQYQQVQPEQLLPNQPQYMKVVAQPQDIQQQQLLAQQQQFISQQQMVQQQQQIMPQQQLPNQSVRQSQQLIINTQRIQNPSSQNPQVMGIGQVQQIPLQQSQMKINGRPSDQYSQIIQ